MTKRISEWRGALPVLTTEQMREVDRMMIEDIGITLIQMMENAGRHLATLARREAKLGGRIEGKRIVILAGRGNNGGGGLVAARRLANWGAEVCVVLAASPSEYQGVPALQLAILQKMGIRIFHAATFPPADLILDCLIGYGLRGAPQGTVANLIRAANHVLSEANVASSSPTPALPLRFASGTIVAGGARVISLDTPSGLDTMTGAEFEPCIRADATLTLALPKVGLLTKSARAVVGELYVADISVPPRVYTRIGIEVPNLFAEHEIVHIQT